MGFSTSKFSVAGEELLASLSTTKALRIKRILVSSTDYSSGIKTGGALDQSVATWVTNTSATMAKVNATLDAASKFGKEARIIVKLTPKSSQTESVPVKTIIITACGVESGVETDEIVYFGLADPDGVEAVYSEGIKTTTSVAINFAFSNDAEITLETAVNPDYVIHSELDRFMSCHVTGDTTSGEDQTVLGYKKFPDGIAPSDIYLEDASGRITGTLFCGEEMNCGISIKTSLDFVDADYVKTIMKIACIYEDGWYSAAVEIDGTLFASTWIHCDGDVIAEQGLGSFNSLKVTDRAVMGSIAATTCMADKFEGSLTGNVTGNLDGLIPVGVDNNCCPDKGGLCVMCLKSTTATSQTRPGAILTKVNATDNWDGPGQHDYVLQLSSFDGVQISSTAAWNVGVQLQVLSIIGHDGVFLAIRIA